MRSFIWGISLPACFISITKQLIKSSKEVGKMYQEREMQVVNTLPGLESQEQDPANEQVCHEKPQSEKNLDTC